MTMNEPEPLIGAVTWHQPDGQWESRGACVGALGLGLGTEDPKWPPVGWRDQESHTLWHYWACGPDPLSTWALMCDNADLEQRDDLSVSGAHPWHWLALHGAGAAMAQWKQAWPTPKIGAWRGDTLIHCAVWSGDSQTLDLALGEEGPMDALDVSGTPALIVAVYRGTPAQVMALLTAGADPDARDLQGRSALHHAALLGNASLLGVLEDAGGDVELADREGDTPASILDDRMEMSQAQVGALRLHWTRRYQRKLRL